MAVSMLASNRPCERVRDMEDICWGTKSRCPTADYACAEGSALKQLIQTRFPIPYYHSAFDLPKMIVY